MITQGDRNTIYYFVNFSLLFIIYNCKFMDKDCRLEVHKYSVFACILDE